MTKKTWIIVILLTVGLLAGLILIARRDRIDVSDLDTSKVLPTDARSGNIAEHTLGKADSKVVLIEYGDYQCPGCKSAEPVIKKITEKYKDKLSFVFRNRPLTNIHPNALAAASAAEAAGLQGKYWEMHDELYTNQNAWNNLSGEQRSSYFTARASDLGLDTSKFNAAVTSPEVKSKIDFDIALATKDGVDGTPTFFLNGEKIDTYSKDGKLVSKGTEGATSVWADFDSFDTLIIQPALKNAGLL